MHVTQRLVTVCVAIFLACSTSLGQQGRSFFLNHRLSEGKSSFSLSSPFVRSQPETVRVLAAMVEFAPDTDPLTTGDGLFDLSTTAGPVIDPPPHNRAYFENHLLFLHNYWRRVTNGKIVVLGTVIDTVIRLQNVMRSYSPRPASTTNRELAQLVHDTWRTVDSVRPALNLPQYNAFVIFHAGVGRDIDLTPVFGFDPAPYDIPSLYLDVVGLRKAFGENYRGVPMRDSSFFVTNSMILPETESRLIPTVGGQFLLQLGINGLLVASLGSYLGLPDLFDTRTGRSGIGRFGLMDGESIFSWGGVFPPEPSAWEKYFLDLKYNLGMLHIIDVNPGLSTYDLQAGGMNEVGKDTILRIPISAKEYFLVENRNRDARRDGAIVSRIFGSDTIVQAFLRDTSGFHAFDQTRIPGVVIDVDEFDFSLPGGVSRGGEFFDGGILIWHIDETVIEANYATNSVNANPRRRGVDLEEADGSQDIGQSYEFLDPGSGSESGTALDFWYEGNSTPVYRNEFSLTSHPNTQSNSGAISHILVKDFARRSPTMKVAVQYGDSFSRPIAGYPKFVGKSGTDSSPQFHKALFVSVGDSVFAFKTDTAISAVANNARGMFSSRGGRYPVACFSLPNDTTLVVGVQDSVLYLWYAADGNGDGVFDDIRVDTMKFDGSLTTPAVVGRSSRGPLDLMLVWVGDSKGNVHRVSLDRMTRSKFAVGNAPVSAVAQMSPVSPVGAGRAVAVGGSSVRIEDSVAFQLPYSSAGWSVVTAEGRVIVADIGGQGLLLLDDDLNLVYRMTVASGGGISPLAIADIDGDGKRDIVFGVGTQLYALNQVGSMVENFPITLPASISGAPVVARLTTDRTITHIIVPTSNGLLTAHTNRGKPYAGFPLAVAGAGVGTPAIFPHPSSTSTVEYPTIFAVDTAGYLSGWRLPEVGNPPGLTTPWGSYRGNVSHTGSDITPLSGKSLSTEFFPASRAYNWPNPVYDGKTSIRYYLNSDAKVRISIYDLSGELVDELTGPGVGGFDNEIEWNVAHVRSGVYFGRIEAEGSGQRGVAIVKIAVVK